MFTFLWRYATVLLAATFCLVLKAHAADSPEQILRQEMDRLDKERQERRREEMLQPLSPTPVPAPAEAPSLPVDEPCFHVKRIHLEPEGVLALRKINRIKSHYEGRCLKSRDLAALQEQFNTQAMTDGLVTTRLSIPEQNLSSGELRLTWWLGHVESVRTEDLTAMEMAMSFPVKNGDVLQLRSLEQGIDNLNRLASFKAKTDLVPGSERGASVVAVHVEKTKPFQLGLSWQADALGRSDENQALRASLVADSPLKLVDRFIIGANHRVDDGSTKKSWGNNIDYDVPFGWYRFNLSASRWESSDLLTSGLTTFKAVSESKNWESSLSRLVKRDEKQRLTVAANIAQQINENFMNGVTIGVSSYRVLSQGLRLNHAYVAAPWVVDSTLFMDAGHIDSAAVISPFADKFWQTRWNSRWQYYRQKDSVALELSGQFASADIAPANEYSLTAQVPGFHAVSVTAPRAMAVQSHYSRNFTVNSLGSSHAQLRLGYAFSASPSTAVKPAQSLSSVMAEVLLPWKVAVSKIQIAKPLTAKGVVAEKDWQLDASLNLQW